MKVRTHVRTHSKDERAFSLFLSEKESLRACVCWRGVRVRMHFQLHDRIRFSQMGGKTGIPLVGLSEHDSPHPSV